MATRRRRVFGTVVAVVRALAVRVKRFVMWMGLASAIVLGWGAGLEPRIVDEKWELASIPGLPPEWAGARMAVIADLQVGMWLANTDTVRRIVRRIVAERPAVVLIAGDFVYHPTEEAGEPREARAELEGEDMVELRRQIGEVIALLRPLTSAGLQTFAVLGNHDYAMTWPDSLPLPAVADALSVALRRAGVVVLRNEAVPLGSRDAERARPDRLHLVGLDDWFPRRTDVAAALDDVIDRTPRLVLMHHPQAFRQLPPGAAPFAIAAHTHGGQIRIPFLPHWSWMSLVKDPPVAADAWIPSSFGAVGNRLYVSRGIGFSLLPIRINCPPELTWFTLGPAEASSVERVRP